MYLFVCYIETQHKHNILCFRSNLLLWWSIRSKRFYRLANLHGNH